MKREYKIQWAREAGERYVSTDSGPKGTFLRDFFSNARSALPALALTATEPQTAGQANTTLLPYLSFIRTHGMYKHTHTHTRARTRAHSHMPTHLHIVCLCKMLLCVCVCVSVIVRVCVCMSMLCLRVSERES